MGIAGDRRKANPNISAGSVAAETIAADCRSLATHCGPVVKVVPSPRIGHPRTRLTLARLAGLTCIMAVDDIVGKLQAFEDADLDRLATYITVERLRRSQAYRLELTRTLDDRDRQNWIQDEDIIDQLGTSDVNAQGELLAFLIGLGENDNLRGEFVEKDNKGRNVEVAVIDRYAVYFHIDVEADSVRVLRIIPTT